MSVRRYFLFCVGIFLVYVMVMLHWMDVVRIICGDPYLSFDRQPFIFKAARQICSVFPWIMLLVLLVRGIARKQWAHFMAAAAAFLLSYALLIAWLFVGPVINDHAHRRSFDPLQWKNSPADGGKELIRLKMIDDLLRKDLLIGRSKEAVKSLLGEATREGQDSLIYWLGPERGFLSIDSESLMITFDQGKVKNARIIRD